MWALFVRGKKIKTQLALKHEFKSSLLRDYYEILLRPEGENDLNTVCLDRINCADMTYYETSTVAD